MSTWQMQEAKFSEAMKRRPGEGPQSITVRGKLVAVLVSRAAYERLAQPKPGFVVLMRASALAVDTNRSLSLTRETLL